MDGTCQRCNTTQDKKVWWEKKGILVEREIRMCIYVTRGRPEREESQGDTDERSQRSRPLASDTTQGARGDEPRPCTDLWDKGAVSSLSSCRTTGSHNVSLSTEHCRFFGVRLEGGDETWFVSAKRQAASGSFSLPSGKPYRGVKCSDWI